MYFNTSWQMIEFRKNDDVDPYWQFVWDLRYIDAPVVWWKDANLDGDCADAGDYVQYFTNDANMNVTALITQSDGSVFERYEYDPYGKCTVLDPDFSVDANGRPDSWNHLLFQGTYYTNVNIGLHLVRNRIYHPTLGRWIQRDPIGYADGQNLQAAYHVMHGGVDPSGNTTSLADCYKLYNERRAEILANLVKCSGSTLGESAAKCALGCIVAYKWGTPGYKTCLKLCGVVGAAGWAWVSKYCNQLANKQYETAKDALDYCVDREETLERWREEVECIKEENRKGK